MKRAIVLLTLLLVGLAQATLAAPALEQPGEGRTTLGRKLLGAWKGEGGCSGQFFFRADGTYELTGYGPGNSSSAGTWKVLGATLPATLVITRKTSDIPDETGKPTELKLVKLDDRSFTIEYSEKNGGPSGDYTRVKK